MTKHIPGPWHYQEGADKYTHIVRAAELRFICQLSQDTTGESEATARMIAAAPELLAALRGAVLCMEAAAKIRDPEWNGTVTSTSAIGEARAAIAKAVGEN